MANEIRVLVAADNLLARAGLAALLDGDETCTITGQSAGDDLAAAIDLAQPDIILYDLGWQVTDALESLAAVSRQEVPVVALIASEDDAPGAIGTLATFNLYGLLLSENDADMLSLALQAVMGGLIVIDPALAATLPPATSPQGTFVESLTARENEVLQLLAQGLTNKAIAHQLGITDHTVKFHVNAIMTKLGAQSRTDAVVRATRAGLIIL